MTSAIPSFVAPVAPQMPAPAAPPASPQNPGFAQMLSQTQQAQQQVESRDASAPADEPAQQPTARTAERGPKAEKADKAAKGDKPAKTEARASERAEDATRADAAHDTATAEEAKQTDPSLADWLAGLHLPPAAPQAPDAAKGGAGRGELAAKGDDAGLIKLKGGPAASTGLEAAAGKDARTAPALPDPATARARPEPSALDAALATTKDMAMSAGADQAATVQELKPVQEFQQQLAAVVPAAPTPGTARAAETAAPVAVQMPVPATSPEFAQSLGVQVSVLARDGVQQAELHLNPADMGPISIQIAIEGTQAQVNFGADSAATREIIENGLPELAASLRDAGFTLSGGGVHSQARGRGDEGGAGRDGQARQGSTPGETDVTAQRTLARVSAGGVDVYA